MRPYYILVAKVFMLPKFLSAEYFKLLDAEAWLLLQSQGFDSLREAALVIGLLQQQGSAALAGLRDRLKALEGVTPEQLDDALKFFAPASA
jgi:tryptophanyl-tRNA synthetase